MRFHESFRSSTKSLFSKKHRFSEILYSSRYVIFEIEKGKASCFCVCMLCVGEKKSILTSFVLCKRHGDNGDNTGRGEAKVTGVSRDRECFDSCSFLRRKSNI